MPLSDKTFKDFTKKLGKGELKDWQIAEEAEKSMKKISAIAADLGLKDDELLPYGHYIAKVDYQKVLARLGKNPDGKFVDVTAITPTPLGEGKSTTTIGLVQGLGRRKKRVTAGIRQPSGGPTMNVKGSAAGGGLAQCIPLTEFSLGFTGDINAIMNAHNLAMVATTARMQHEFNKTDAEMKKIGLKRLDIDPRNVQMGWIMDFCAQALRKIVIGLGDKKNGFMMESRFDIAVSSEVMAILAIAKDLKDFRERIGRIVVGYSKSGTPVTCEDLKVAGAMTAWMMPALNPSLIQTIEGQPVFVHAGPFANIAIGQSSIIQDRVALKLVGADGYHVTESGFAADIGFEKFWNLKCRFGNLTPNAVVIVATIRALKSHGGAPVPVPGKPLPEEYRKENVGFVEKGAQTNLLHMVNLVKKSGANPVVCINAFYTDTDNEIKAVRRICEQAGARVAVSKHWQYGGEGALELADAVVDACKDKPKFKFLYDLSMPQMKRIDLIAREVYGADGADFSAEAASKLKAIEADKELSKLGTCMVKTHLSLSDNPTLKGTPKGWRLFVRDVLTFRGAGFVVPVAGAITLMPGTASDPAYHRIDVDVKTGKVKGVF